MKLPYATDVRSAAITCQLLRAELFADYLIGCVGTGAEWLTGKHEASTGLATAEELLARVLGSDQRRPPEVTR